MFNLYQSYCWNSFILYWKNECQQAYNICSIFKFNEELTDETNSKIAYYLKQINIDINEDEKRTGYSFKKYEILKVPKCPDDLTNYINLFFEFIEKILKSNCIKDLVIKLKDHHNDKNDIIKIDEDFIQYIKNNTVFCEFFETRDFWLTKFRELKTFINIDFRSAI